MTEELKTGFERWLTEGPAARPDTGVSWLDERRRRAAEQVRVLGEPTSKDEAWRYTSLKGLVEQGFAPSDEPITALQPDDLEDLIVPGLDSYRVVLVNGRLASELSSLADLPAGASIDGLADLLKRDPDALRDRLSQVAGPQPDFFSALNLAGLDDGVVILIDRDAALDRPIEVIHVSVGLDEPRVAQPRNLVLLGDAAQAVLVERYVSFGDTLYCTNSVLEISLGRDATLRHDRIQTESASAFHITGLYLQQQGGSSYLGVNIGLGGRWARTDLRTFFQGEGAVCDLQGLYLAGDGQLVDFHLDVDHAMPSCTSRETFKGILYGKGRAVFDGLVFVAKDAQKTDAAMSNRNLMLSESAEVDTKPQLEINADDVKCSHGTTVGQLEPEMLFYLRSRGISEPLARRMLCLGFAGEIIERLSSEALQTYVAEIVGRRLEVSALS